MYIWCKVGKDADLNLLLVSEKLCNGVFEMEYDFIHDQFLWVSIKGND